MDKRMEVELKKKLIFGTFALMLLISGCYLYDKCVTNTDCGRFGEDYFCHTFSDGDRRCFKPFNVTKEKEGKSKKY